MDNIISRAIIDSKKVASLKPVPWFFIGPALLCFFFSLALWPLAGRTATLDGQAGKGPVLFGRAEEPSPHYSRNQDPSTFPSPVRTIIHN
jgi:hypothetical protein